MKNSLFALVIDLVTALIKYELIEIKLIKFSQKKITLQSQRH